MKSLVPRAPSAKPRILHVEDSEVFAWLLRSVLEDEGFDVEHARTVGEARGFLTRDRPDLLLLDFNLPDGLGIDLLPSLIPSIILSGAGDPADEQEAERRGATVFIHKDARISDLLAALRVARVCRA